MRRMPLERVMARTATLAAVTLLGACNTMSGDASVRLAGEDYNRAFTACIEAGREQDMPPALADRGNGIIETEPRSMGSLIEPWRTDTSGLEQMAESTLQFQRRRVRFVFTPEGWEPEAIDGRSDFAGAAEPGSPADTARFDLETWRGPIELRTRVFIERGFTPGIRTSTWSSALSTMTTEPARKGPADDSTRSPTQWTPIGRDEAAERTITARVRALLEAQGVQVTSGQPAVEPSS
jgi:predicted small secreted protein